LVAKKAVKSGSGRSYVSFLVKDLLKLRTLGNTSFFHSVLKTGPKKLLALKSFLTNLGNAANVRDRIRVRLKNAEKKGRK